MTKYRAKACVVNGTRYASQKEAKYCEGLKLLEKAGQIHSLVFQPQFPIWINGIKCFIYIADGQFVEGSKRIVFDVKGVKTPMYKLKKRCVEAYYSIKIMEV